MLLAPLSEAHGREVPGEPLNVVFILLDTLRADHLSCYGYSRKTSPSIDKLADQGVLFEQAISQANWTLSSVASLFTSKYPPDHGAVSELTRLADSELTLAEALQEQGYRTAAFVGPSFVSPEFGLAQGFQIYRSTSPGILREIMPQVFTWLDQNGKGPFFLFLHSVDLHTPYAYNTPFHFRELFDPGYDGAVRLIQINARFFKVYNSEPWEPELGPAPPPAYASLVEQIRDNPRDREHIASYYDGAIAYADSFLGPLWEKLERLGLRSKTMILLTSDHGEALGERGRMGHDFCLQDEIIRVPLILSHPRWSGRPRRIREQVEMIDVSPTILHLLNLPIPPSFRGESLRPLLEGHAKGGKSYALSFWTPKTPIQQVRVTMEAAIRSKRWKFIPHPGACRALFDLRRDPMERQDVASSHPDITRRLALELERRLKPQAAQEP